MIKAYYLIIDPIDRSSISGIKDYVGEITLEKALSLLLQELRLTKEDCINFSKTSCTSLTFSNYIIYCGSITNTSKIVSIEIVSLK